MNKLVALGTLVLALGAFTSSAQAADFWGQLKKGKTGAWAREKVMKKGYLGMLTTKAEKFHSAFAKLAREALSGLNGLHGKCGGRWPNFRMALANVLAGATMKKGAGAALAGPLGAALKGFQGGCAKVGKGGQAEVIKGLQAAIKELRGKAKPGFLKKLRTAIAWMKKPNLWAGK